MAGCGHGCRGAVNALDHWGRCRRRRDHGVVSSPMAGCGHGCHGVVDTLDDRGRCRQGRLWPRARGATDWGPAYIGAHIRYTVHLYSAYIKKKNKRPKSEVSIPTSNQARTERKNRGAPIHRFEATDLPRDASSESLHGPAGSGPIKKAAYFFLFMF